MRRALHLLAATVALPALTAACGGSSTPSGGAKVTKAPGGVQQLNIDTTDDFRFVPADFHAHVGKLRIVLTSHGSYPHNLSFPGLHTTSKTVSGNPGQQTATIVVTLAHGGSYDFVCTFHSSAGMKGHITVS
jgi:plastocyanin